MKQSFYSEDLEKGIKLIWFQSNSAKYKKGIACLERAVANNEPDAYYFLARCYAWEDGGIKEDLEKASELSKKGIELGSDLCVLGADRFQGLEGEVWATMKGSLADSFDAVQRMAEAGNPMAQYAIGLFYFWQDISELQDPIDQEEFEMNQISNSKESHKWFDMSAQQGCVPACINIFSSLYDGNNGIEQDRDTALAYIHKAKSYVDLPASIYGFVTYYQFRAGHYLRAIVWCLGFFKRLIFK